MAKTDKEKAASAKVLLSAFAAHKKKLNSESSGKKSRVPKIVGDAPGPKKSKGKGAATSALASEEKRRKARIEGNKHAQLGKDEFSPGDRARERDKGPSLARTLTTIAASVKPGNTKAGAAISGALSGAAIGATIDESGAERKRRAARAKAKKKNDA